MKLLTEILNPIFWLRKTCSVTYALLKFPSAINGTHRLITVGEVYKKYRELHMPSLTELSRVKMEDRARKFLPPLIQERMATLTPVKMAKFITQTKTNYKQGKFARRYDFKREISDLRGIFAWWKTHFDFKFEQPLKPFHNSLSVIDEKPEKNRKITPEETLRFLRAVDPKFRDFFEVALYASGRCGEIAGIQVKNIDLERRILTIREVITWIKNKPTIKHLPKNNTVREVFINDTMMEILKRRIPLVPEGCPFLFHNVNNRYGWGLKYNRLNRVANSAWKKAGLGDKFSGVHYMRYSGTQIARKVSGSIEATASVSGHLSREMCELYAPPNNSELNRITVIQMEAHMKKVQESA